MGAVPSNPDIQTNEVHPQFTEAFGIKFASQVTFQGTERPITDLEKMGERVLDALNIDLPGQVQNDSSVYGGTRFTYFDEKKNIGGDLKMVEMGLHEKNPVILSVRHKREQDEQFSPKVTLKARWGYGEMELQIEGAEVIWNRNGSKNEYDLVADLDADGKLVRLSVNKETKDLSGGLKAIMHSVSRDMPGETVDFTEDKTGLPEAVGFLALQTGDQQRILEEGVDIQKTMSNFIKTGEVSKTPVSKVASPVWVKKS